MPLGSTPPTIAQLADRIRIEQLVGTVWAPLAVVWASVQPIPPRPASALSSSLASIPAFSQAGSAYEVTIRYRTDLARGMQIRRGADALVIRSIDDLDGFRLFTRILCDTWTVYATRHDTALAQVLREGAPVTFSMPTTTSSDSSTYDALSDNPADPAAVTTVAGAAVEEPGTVGATFEPNSFVDLDSRNLIFVPTTYGQVPQTGMTAIWGGNVYAVDRVLAIAPDGVPIGARLTVKR